MIRKHWEDSQGFQTFGRISNIREDFEDLEGFRGFLKIQRIREGAENSEGFRTDLKDSEGFNVRRFTIVKRFGGFERILGDSGGFRWFRKNLKDSGGGFRQLGGTSRIRKISRYMIRKDFKDSEGFRGFGRIERIWMDLEDSQRFRGSGGCGRLGGFRRFGRIWKILEDLKDLEGFESFISHKFTKVLCCRWWVVSQYTSMVQIVLQYMVSHILYKDYYRVLHSTIIYIYALVK